MREQLHPAFWIEYRPDGIILFDVRTSANEVVDLWVERWAQEDQKAYANNKSILTLSDVSLAPAATVYFFQKMLELAQKTPPDLKEKIAFVYNDKWVMWRVTSYFMDKFPLWTQTKLRIFRKNQEDEAIKWLLEEDYE